MLNLKVSDMVKVLMVKGGKKQGSKLRRLQEQGE